MNQMKQKLLAGLLALTTLAALTACGDTGSTADHTSSTTSTTSAADSSQAESSSDAENSGAQTAELEKTSFELGHLNSTAHLLAFDAAEEGFFEEEGLNVTLTQFASAAELVTS